MTYYDELMSNENIKSFEDFQNHCFESGRYDKTDLFGIEDFLNFSIEDEFGLEDSKEKGFTDKSADDEDIRMQRMINYKSRKIVNAKRGETGESIIWRDIALKNKQNFENNRLNILKFIMEYIKNHIEQLSSRGPSRRVLWSKTDTFNFFKACNVVETEIRNVIKTVPQIKSNWEIGTNPLNLIMAVLICHFWQNRTEKEKKEKNYKSTMVFILNLIFCIRFYSSIYMKYFEYDPDEELMNSVIDELSGRFNLKKMNNVYELLELIAYTNINNTIDIMNNPTDFNVYYFMTNLNGRINSTIRTIANAFYEKYEKTKHSSVEKMVETNSEGDDYLNETSSVSGDIANVVRKLLIKLAGESDIDTSILEIVCKQTKVSVAKMRVAINEMRDKDKETVGRLISLILSYYLGSLKKKKSTIRSIGFISIMKKVYSVSNTNSELIIEIKEVLDILLKNHSKEYLTTNRAATLSNLKITCYLYWVMYINSRCE